MYMYNFVNIFKVKTVISAEEEHLASKSVKTSKKVIKKICQKNEKIEPTVQNCSDPDTSTQLYEN